MPGELQLKKTLLSETQMRRIIRRIAGQIVERNGGVEDVVLVGIRTRGVPLAERLADEIEVLEGVRVPIGVLDITLCLVRLRQRIGLVTHAQRSPSGHAVRPAEVVALSTAAIVHDPFATILVTNFD